MKPFFLAVAATLVLPLQGVLPAAAQGYPAKAVRVSTPITTSTAGSFG
ncbi:MAG: hypothetical protein ACK4N4_07695 [Burkholderiales bacterium]